MGIRTHTSEGPQVSKYTRYSVISTEKKRVKRRGKEGSSGKVKCVEDGGMERSGELLVGIAVNRVACICLYWS